MTSEKPTIAFFGATGGCAFNALCHALQAGYTCSALVRTAGKLEGLLSARSVPTTTLTVHIGNIRSPSSIRPALLTSSSSSSPTLCNTIVYGIGGTPQLRANLIQPVTLTDPSICGEGMGSVLSALAELKEEFGSAKYVAPLVATISTTGLSEGGLRDVPLAFVPFYKWALAVPHKDKKDMERRLTEASGGVVANDGWVIIKPALLTDGALKGEAAVRAGYEGRQKGGSWGGGEGVEGGMGYTISRADVGGWIWEELLQVKDGAGAAGGEWRGKRVRLAY